MSDEEMLQHYGILGMKWGVRRTPAQLTRANGRAGKTESSDEINDRRKLLDGWRKIDETVWEYKGIDERIDLHLVTTASKRMTQNVWEGNLQDFDSSFYVSEYFEYL